MKVTSRASFVVELTQSEAASLADLLLWTAVEHEDQMTERQYKLARELAKELSK